MRIPKDHVKEIMSELLPLLREETEMIEVIRRLKGSTIKNFMNVHTDRLGKPIVDSTVYEFSDYRNVKINHTRRVRSLIDQAVNIEELQDLLGKYLARFAKDPEEISNKIVRELRR